MSRLTDHYIQSTTRKVVYNYLGMISRQVQKITNEVSKVEKGSLVYYTKESINNNPDQTSDEYLGYNLISNYLETPIVHRINDNASRIAIKEASGYSLDKMLYRDLNSTLEALDACFSDIRKMWRLTLEKPGEKHISYDTINEAQQTYNLFNSSLYQQHPYLENSLVINNKKYISIKEVVSRLKQKPTINESVVISHGDEHFKNIFYSKRGGYSIIDPRRAGYQAISSTLNRLIGSTLIFILDYEVDLDKTLAEAGINFKSVLTSSKYEILLSKFEEYISELNLATNGQNNYKFLIIANLLRAFLLNVNSKNLEKVTKNRYAYLALASQIYNNEILC